MKYIISLQMYMTQSVRCCVFDDISLHCLYYALLFPYVSIFSNFVGWVIPTYIIPIILRVLYDPMCVKSAMQL